MRLRVWGGAVELLPMGFSDGRKLSGDLGMGLDDVGGFVGVGFEIEEGKFDIELSVFAEGSLRWDLRR